MVYECVFVCDCSIALHTLKLGSLESVWHMMSMNILWFRDISYSRISNSHGKQYVFLILFLKVNSPLGLSVKQIALSVCKIIDVNLFFLILKKGKLIINRERFQYEIP